MKANHTEVTSDTFHDIMGPLDVISATITEDEHVFEFRNKRPFGYRTPGYVNYKDGVFREPHYFIHNNNLNNNRQQ